MLEQLRKVTQAVNLAEDKQAMLDAIVNETCKVLKVDICSIYLADYQANQFVLMANQGLNSDFVGQIRLDFNQGLVGLIGQREEPIHLHQASDHPSFSTIPEFADLKFNAFLGVPIIHRRKVLGVLVVQQKDSRRFALDEETFLITLATQLSSILSYREMSETLDFKDSSVRSRTLRGSPASSGIAIGTAKVIFPGENINSVPDRLTDDIQGEIAKLGVAVKATHMQLERMSRKMRGLVSEQERSLFDAYKQILSSKGLGDEVELEIKQGYWAASALRIVIQRHLKAFKSMQDPYLRERANDIEDLANRVLAQLLKTNHTIKNILPGTILVAEIITAAMLAELPVENIAGIVSLKGSATSHAAILAKALGIPAVMGLAACPITKIEDKILIVDGYNGQLYISPSAEIIKQFNDLIQEDQQLCNELAKDDLLPNVSKDGHNIQLMLNCSVSTDLQKAKSMGADGVGLYRTEIPFMQLEQFPSEEAQRVIYRGIILAFDDSPVTLRTLDIGGDKQLSYFPINEENPFLGWRGVRVTLDHPEIFLVQLRAIFKASEGHQKLKIALPLVSTIEELIESKRLIEQAFSEVEIELDATGKTISRPKIGMILEVPATVFQLRNFAKRVDFISVGTNDLIQYLMAVDRNNIQVKDLYSHFQPAVLSVLQYIAKECKREKIEFQICGEMAADPVAAVLLVGMGYRQLSVNVSALARVKRALSSFDIAEMQALVETVTQFETEAKVKDYLMRAMEAKGLGGLVRAGN